MATVAEIQTQLNAQGLLTGIVIEKKFTVSTTDTFYCRGGVTVPGRNRWCPTTNTNSAATQAAAIVTAMTA
jgi:hypothetical protein